MRAIILGSGRGIRRLDSAESTPRGLVRDEHGRAVIDYQIEALRHHGVEQVDYLAGYHIEKMVEAHPEVTYHYDPDWQAAGNLHALLAHLDVLRGPCLVALGDAVFHDDVLAGLEAAGGEITLGVVPFVDPQAAWQAETVLEPEDLIHLDGDEVTGFGPRDDVPPDARFGGVIYLTEAGARRLGKACQALLDNPAEPRPGHLERLIDRLCQRGLRPVAYRAPESLRRLDGRGDLARFLLGTKADTLERLGRLVTTATVLDQVTIELAGWQADPEAFLEDVQAAFGQDEVVVRSSTRREDGWQASHAGAFESVLGVPAGDPSALEAAISEVVESFGRDGQAEAGDQILVQPQVTDVACSGVVFTRDLDGGGPATVINYDAESGRSDSITSGQAASHRTLYLSNLAEDRAGLVEGWQASLVQAIDELRAILEDPPLDVEFAIDGAGEVYLLQVRPLTAPAVVDGFDRRDVRGELDEARATFQELSGRRPHLVGEGTVLGVMPDWNPAEMIGTDPLPLARSVYRYLITDEVWARARAASGYRDVRPAPLMVTLAGRPYIDTLVDFNSFLPADLEDEVAEQLVEHYLDRLRANPHLHDKVEFEIVVTCRHFGFEAEAERLRAAGIPEAAVDALDAAITELTDDILAGRRAGMDEQMARIEHLIERRAAWLEADRDSWAAAMRVAGGLLDDARELGTLPFSVLARYAFIATSLLDSLVACGVLSMAEREAIVQDAPTVANALTRDMERLRAGELGLEAFLAAYGHLRPGSYDVTSPRYDRAPGLYLDQPSEARAPARATVSLDEAHAPDRARKVFEAHEAEIQALLEAAGFSVSPDELLAFILRAIPLRERAKFEFTKNLSDALEILAEAAERHLRLSREDLAFLTIDRLLEARVENPSAALARQLEREVGLARKRRLVQSSVPLPPLVGSGRDLVCFELTSGQPTFITDRSVQAPVVLVDEVEDAGALEGAIAMIPSADPGYDWVFGRGIVGLITQYGGVASHMAIRAAEFGLPAAIGCGEVVFDRLRGARRVVLDCAGGVIRVVG